MKPQNMTRNFTAILRMKSNALKSKFTRGKTSPFCRLRGPWEMGLIGASLAFGAGALQAVNIPTQHGDNNRSGLNASETILTPANVNQNSFGKIFEKYVDGDIYAQPLYMQGVNVGGGGKNVIYVATANNSIYAFDADNGSAGAYWTRNCGPAVPQQDVQCCCTDVSHVIGIIGTGAIDTSTGTWYFVHKQENADHSFHHYLHAVDITNGAEKFSGPKEISGGASGVNFDAKLNNQRAGLLLQGGNVYIGWSSHNDCGGYHGWVMGYKASTLAQVGVFPVTTSSGTRGGVWMAGTGLVGDGSSVYFMTGNGSFDANSGGGNYSECFVKLSSTLARQDYFAPFDQASLTSADRDLGGGGMALIPGTSRLVGGGKGGKWYLVNTGSMGGYNASQDACLQSFMVTDTSDGLNHIHGGPSYFNGTLYVGGESDQLKAFHWNGSTISTTPSSQSSFEAVTNSMPGWQHSVSANGTSNGIVWAARVYSGNANNATQPGILHAFDATNLGTELWNSYQNVGRDDLGNFAKNPAPVVANGKVYCPTFSNKLVVYGLLSPVPNGIYEMTARASGLALDAVNNGTANGTAIDQWGYNSGANQQWYVTNVGGGQIKVTGLQSLRVLDVTGGSTADGTPLELWDWNNGANQRWTLTTRDSGYYSLLSVNSGKALDVTGGSTTNGAIIEQYTSNNTYAQYWNFLQSAVPNGKYKLIARCSGKSLDVTGNGTANGSLVEQWSYKNGTNEQWQITNLGGGQYEIIGVQSGRALDVVGGNTADGTAIDIWDYSGGANQKWTITATNSGYYTLLSVNSGKALDVAASGTTDGVKVQQYTSNGTAAQQWRLEPVP